MLNSTLIVDSFSYQKEYPIVLFMDNVSFDIFDSIPHPLLVKDAEDEFRYVFWSRHNTFYTNITKEDALGKNDFELLGKEFADERKAIDLELIANNNVYRADVLFTSPNGIKYQAVVEKRCISINNHKYILVLMWDVNKEDKSQTMMIEVNRQLLKYQTIADLAIHQSDMYIWEYYQKSDSFLHIDKALIEKYNIDPNSVFRKESFLNIIHPDDREMVETQFANLLNGETNLSIDCRVNIVSKNQTSYQWYRYKANSLYTEEGRVLIGTGMCIDTFVRERELLTSLIDEAEKSSKQASAFFANMSHEIRNPLNSVIGFAGLIAETDDRETRLEYAKIMKSESDLLMTLVNDILDLSKLEAGTMVNRPEPIDLAVVFEEITMSLRMTLTNPKIEFIVEHPYKSCLVLMDRNRFTQVTNNYVSNAFKYTEEGSVTVGYEYVDKGIKLYVKDTGIGIPKDKQDKVFGRFAKLDSYAKGNGLGLSIVKALTESVGGKVGFTSEEGVGSTFWAWRPCKAEITK